MGFKPDVKPLKDFEDHYGPKLDDGEEAELGDEDEFEELSEDDDGNYEDAALNF
jgi:hypothetical protein